MLHTRITDLFGIDHPVVMSGMSWISTPEMVAAVCNAGGLGILATGPLNQQTTREAVRRVRELTDKPFGANATLLFPGARENAEVLLDEEVPVINYALGKGDWICEAAHRYGGKVAATVVKSKHALKAQEHGCDAVIATGHEAAAHGEAVTSLLLVPSLADEIDIPVIAAGGFGDGRGLAAALALGADAVAMGTRFMTTVESPLHPHYKQLSVEKTVYDTLFSQRFDGIDCRVIDAPGARRQLRAGLNLVQLLRAVPNSRFIAEQMHMPYLKLFLGVLISGWKNASQLAYMANAFDSLSRATQNGDLEGGWLTVGQVTGLIHDIPTVDELVQSIVTEACEIRDHGLARVA